jgi:hypothetical protein
VSILSRQQKQRYEASLTDNVIPFSRSSTQISGMPDMDTSGPAVSRYEFWPSWVFYTPVIIQSLWHSIRYRSVGLPLIANPSIWLSGMVGESKRDILNLAGPHARTWILPFITQSRSQLSTERQLEEAKRALQNNRLSYPLVAKPDKGCRGAGVRLINNDQQLLDYIENFPQGADYLLQKKSDYDAEAGVFWVRYPGERRGHVFSLTLKYAPHLIGDGIQTLGQLIDADPRASQLARLYKDRHASELDRVLPAGMAFRLAFAGSHCRGSIFKNGNRYITKALTERLDEIFDDFTGFHYGRLDIKFRDIDSLIRGQDFQIIEINGASSEATHIWDSKTPLNTIFSTLLYQYKTLYQIGYLQHQAGYRPPSLRTLFRALKEERRLVKQYPSTD